MAGQLEVDAWSRACRSRRGVTARLWAPMADQVPSTRPACGRCGNVWDRGTARCSPCSWKRRCYLIFLRAACWCWTTRAFIRGRLCVRPWKRRDARCCFCRLTRLTSTQSSWCGAGLSTWCEHSLRETMTKDETTSSTSPTLYHHNTPKAGSTSADSANRNRYIIDLLQKSE